MATTTQQQSFIDTYKSYAKGVSYQTGIPSDFILGQWALETGWGTKFAGAYNVGNIQGAAAKPYDYVNLQAGVKAYGDTLSNLRYSDARMASTPEAFGAALKNAGYASDPDYASKIAATINSVSGILGSESNTSGGGMFDFNFDPMGWLKSRGLDVVFLVVGGGLILFLLVNATKSDATKAIVNEVV